MYKKMKYSWTMIIVTGFITMTAFWMQFAHAAEIQHVQFGSTVTLGCNISYLYHTTWLRHNPDLTPTVILSASLKDGHPFQEFRLSSRFSVELMNRSLALRVTDVEERDLGLYYCIAIVKTQLSVGKGTTLQVSSPGSVWFVFHSWYCVAVGLGLLILVLAVCISHWKAKSYTRIMTNSSTANCT